MTAKKTQPISGTRKASLTANQRMAILKALADPRRLEIVERLGSCPDCVGCSDFRDAMPISAATLSHHMKELENAELIHIEREGKFARLSLRRDVWQAFISDLQLL